MSDTFRIVPYLPKHVEAWRGLNEAWLAEGGYELEPHDHAVLGDPEGAVLARGGSIIIAERDGEAVGCCSVSPMADGGYEVGKLAVAPAVFGLGIGRALLNACEDVAISAGAPRLYLETHAAQRHAIVLYDRFGFVPLAAQPTPCARCNVQMEKRL